MKKTIAADMFARNIIINNVVTRNRKFYCVHCTFHIFKKMSPIQTPIHNGTFSPLSKKT